MGLLVRKINRSKWPQEDEKNVFKVASDAITICLKSCGNTLSVWEIDNEQNLDEAVLALASGFQHLESIDVVMLESDRLQAEIKSKQTKGQTPVKDLEHIIEKLRQKKIKRYTISDLKKILNTAIATGRLKREDLNASVANKL